MKRLFPKNPYELDLLFSVGVPFGFTLGIFFAALYRNKQWFYIWIIFSAISLIAQGLWSYITPKMKQYASYNLQPKTQYSLIGPFLFSFIIVAIAVIGFFSDESLKFCIGNKGSCRRPPPDKIIRIP